MKFRLHEINILTKAISLSLLHVYVGLNDACIYMDEKVCGGKLFSFF